MNVDWNSPRLVVQHTNKPDSQWTVKRYAPWVGVSPLLQTKDADYEQVPIEQYGLAMLRGMGWEEGHGVGKTSR